jgi:hypothetical protein
MKLDKRTAAIVASGVLAISVGGEIADAAQSSGINKADVAGQHAPGPGPGAAAIADYLGVTAAELRTQLRSGKTLAQIATAEGKTVSGLEEAIVAAAKSRLDADVADGNLTAAQAATFLANVKEHVADMVDRTAPPRGGHGGPGGPGGHGAGPFGGAAITTYLGITAAELRTQLQAGKTLAQIAAAEGKTASGLEDAIVADAKKHLDAEVADGNLTAAQAAAKLASLNDRVSEMVNNTGPPPGGHRGPGGQGFGPPPTTATG